MGSTLVWTRNTGLGILLLLPLCPFDVSNTPVVQAAELTDLLDNTATADPLKRLPGIGEAVSEKSMKGAETNKRPFWTKQSSFVEGEDLFVVGMAPHAPTVEEGRKRAFENAKVELMNFAQVTDLEAKGLVIETQMTFEEEPIAKHSRTCSLQFVTRGQYVGHLVTDMVNAAARIALQEFGDRRRGA